MLQKVNPETLKMLEDQLKILSTPELEILDKKMEALVQELDKIFMSQKLTKDKILGLFNSRGYYPKKGDKLYKITAPTHGHGMYGWQVGEYEHSCHSDTTDLKVLLVVEPGPHGQTYVGDFADLWLDGPTIV